MCALLIEIPTEEEKAESTFLLPENYKKKEIEKLEKKKQELEKTEEKEIMEQGEIMEIANPGDEGDVEEEKVVQEV